MSGLLILFGFISGIAVGNVIGVMLEKGDDVIESRDIDWYISQLREGQKSFAPSTKHYFREAIVPLNRLRRELVRRVEK